MTNDSFQAGLKAFFLRKPFQHFLIGLVSGDRLLVRHPEALTSAQATYHLVGPDRKNRIFDASVVAQILDLPSE